MSEVVSKTIIIVLIALLVFAAALAVKFYTELAHTNLRMSTLKKEVDRVNTDRETFYLENMSLKEDVSKLANWLKSIVSNPPAIYAKGKVRKTFEIRSNGNNFCRIKSNFKGEVSKKETHTGEIVFHITTNHYAKKSDLIKAFKEKSATRVVEALQSVPLHSAE